MVQHPHQYQAHLMVVVHHLQVEWVPLPTALVVVVAEEVRLLVMIHCQHYADSAYLCCGF